MAELPSGTVTFLFTDIEGSTTRWEHRPEAMQVALARHDALLRAAIVEHDGHVVKTMGDAFHAAFVDAPAAVAAALDAQGRLQAEPWDDVGGLRVRMALHTGVAEERGGDYYGSTLNRAARLMSAGHGGQILLSRVTGELVGDALADGVALVDLGEHRLKDLIRPERIFQVSSIAQPTDFPPLRTLDVRANNLPIQPTALVGRDRAVAEILALFKGGTRLVTLTGPGGTGKTRLGMQVAAEIDGGVDDGTWLVELAAISDPALVPSTIAQALGVREVGGRPALDAVREHLRGRSLLLVLDNFEQILPAGSAVSDLLAASRGLKVLVSSREPLRLRGEVEYAVPPLSLPDASRPATPASLSESAAVTLFVERASAVRTGFVVTDGNAPAIGEICARLDGLPLAIELAAARVRLLTPQAMAARLERRLPLLMGGARDLPTRQQTLRGAIDWSHDLLDEGERRLFRRLGVFAGGWTLDVVEAVCNLDGDLDVLGGLESLVSKSLVRQDEDAQGEPRFGMLETIREYALEQLEASGEAEAARRAHAAFFLALAEEAAPKLLGSEQITWLRRLAAEIGNLRAALAWFGERGPAETSLQLAVALQEFWVIRGHYAEGRRWLTDPLQHGPVGAPALCVKALSAAGRLARLQGDYPAARALLEDSVARRREVGDTPGLATSLYELSWIAHDLGDIPSQLALVEQSLALFQQLEDRLAIANCRRTQGHGAWHQREYPRARALLTESITLMRELGDRRSLGLGLMLLGEVLVDEGDATGAGEPFAEGLSLSRELGEIDLTWRLLDKIASAALALGGPGRAARLMGAAEAIREAHDMPLSPVYRRDYYDALLAKARGASAPEVLTARWAEGRAMPLERAIAYALDASAPA